MTILKTTIFAVAALTMSACSTTGITSDVGHGNKDLIEAVGRTLNNDAQAIQNEDNATSTIYNRVLVRGQFSELAGTSFDWRSEWAIVERELGEKRAPSQRMLMELERRTAKNNKAGRKAGIWVTPGN